MPVSVMKFVTVKASATRYDLMCFMFGGSEEILLGQDLVTLITLLR